ncbi:hypothetical protein SLEP1_g27576 [Rubroshorea leprosula]|uniref:Reverse transcriptase Ty1/copia-type domain-containing protein n=1 Tax=Rubroshorea leprosula TaxID=152421 RepID=A0AAV5K051_9ROSI|nr:hypothetical protein SLEP1_g27576 [Rubroshorea leprosula]
MADQSPSTDSSKTAITTPAIVAAPTVGNPNTNSTNVITFNVAIQFPVKLTTNNYSSWSRQFISLLKVYRLYEFLLGTRPCPLIDPTPDSPYDVWVRQDQSIQHAILTSITESIHPYVASTETAHEAWIVLERLYANNSQTRIVAFKERLSNLKCDSRTITNYLRTVKELINRISRAEKTPLSNSTIQVHFLTVLGSEYYEFKASIRARDGPPLSFEDLQDRLLAYEESLQREYSRQELQAPLMAQFATATPKFNGDYHNAMNSVQPTSFNSYGPSSNQPTRSGSPNWQFNGPVNCGNRGGCGRGGRRNSVNRNHAHVANFASTSRKARNEWWIDYGASDHVSPDLSNLALHSEYGGPDELLIGDGSDRTTGVTLLRGHNHHGVYRLPAQGPPKTSPMAMVFYSRHVVFDEHDFFYQKSHNSVAGGGTQSSVSPSKLATVSPPDIASPQACSHGVAHPHDHQGTWELVPRTDVQNVIGCKWVFRVKRNEEGGIDRYKARLVAKRFHQRPGSDYFNTFSPVIKPTPIRTVLLLAVNKHWPIRRWISQPQHVCRLRKSIYGLKQAPRTCTEKLIESIISLMGATFSIKDLGCLNYFLGVNAIFTNAGLFLLQAQYIRKLLAKFGMSDAKPMQSPLSTVPLQLHQGNQLSDAQPYCQLVGSLQYLVVTRPDISFAVNKLSQFLHAPSDVHWQAAKRILRYRKGSLFHGLLFCQQSISPLHAFSYSDWAGNKDTYHSTTGYVVFLCSNLISWRACKQKTIARSSTEASLLLLLNWFGLSICFMNLAILYLNVLPFTVTMLELPI